MRADWLECPDREHVCHLMDTNNPVWREYVKAVIRIQVDAGVDGIQFDEPDGPMGSLQYGGCFCKDCMRGFAAHLRALSPDDVPEHLAAVREAGFHYGRWLLEHGQERIDPVDPDFLARAYVTYARAQNAANFHELAEYARQYAAAQGRSLLISANLYDGAPWHDPLVADVDVLVPEQRHTLYRQPGWMRYIAAFGGDKPVTLSFNPYGGILPELVTALDDGRAMDRYRVMLYEAAAMGVNMSVPYGAWMGSVIEDAMYAPHNATCAIQDFIADHDHLYSHTTANDTAVVYSMDSNLHHEAFGAALQARIDPATGRRGGATSGASFFRAANALARRLRVFDVVIFHDGQLRDDDIRSEDLARYRHLVLPDCRDLTLLQAEALARYLDDGGHVTVIGQLDAPGHAETVTAILTHPGTTTTSVADLATVTPRPPQVGLRGPVDAAANLQVTAAGTTALHIVNYDYDHAASCTRVYDEVSVTVRLPRPVTRACIHAPDHDTYTAPVTATGPDTYGFTLPSLGCYAVVELD